MDVQNILIAITTTINAIFGAVVYFRKRTGTETAYGLLTTSVILWSFAMFFFRTTDGITALFWVKLLYASAVFIAVFFLYFSVIFLNNHQPLSRWLKSIIITTTVFILILIFLPETVVRSVNVSVGSEPVIIWGSLYPFYTVFISGYFLYTFFLLFKKRATFEKTERAQVNYVISGTLLSAIFGTGANLLLPSFGIFTYNWLGQVTTVFMIGFIAYAVLKYNLFNIKIIATEIFAALLVIALLVKLFGATSFQDFLIQAIILAGVVLTSVFLIRSVHKEVESREHIEKLAKQLEEANVELKKLDAAKSEFISLASHQLRAPLTIVKGYVSMMQEGSFGKQDERTQKVLQRVYDANEHLVKLVADFLNLSRIEAGKLKYIVEPVRVQEMVEEILENLRGAAEQKHLELRWIKPSENIPQVEMDKEKIHQSVFNLVDNAIKYTEKGFVEAGARLADKGRAVEIFVRDSGMGLGEEDKQKLFQKFSRASGAATNTSGLGIGLYLAYKMVQDHGGKIWAESDGAGKGSTFVIRLPVHSHLVVERGELMERKPAK